MYRLLGLLLPLGLTACGVTTVGGVNQIQLAIYHPLCVDVQLASKAPGARLQAYPCGPGKLSQEWVIRPASANGSLASNGLFIVMNANSEMCMTVASYPDSPVTDPGQYVIQAPCSPDASDPTQIWTITQAPSGEAGIRFISTASNQCLDLPYGAAASIFTLQQYYCTPKDPAQGWIIHGVSKGSTP
jgi:ricin-type beta-trefoil lectin protein